MKITKKLAKEIFMGDFSNVNLEELTKANKGRVNRFESISEIEQLYKENLDIPILKKDFDGFKMLELVKVANEDYKRSKGHLQTDVFCLQKLVDGYYLSLYRYNSISYHKQLNFSFDEQTKKEIINRILDKLNTNF